MRKYVKIRMLMQCVLQLLCLNSGQIAIPVAKVTANY